MTQEDKDDASHNENDLMHQANPGIAPDLKDFG
jgi:hypothetical protein